MGSREAYHMPLSEIDDWIDFALRQNILKIKK